MVKKDRILMIPVCVSALLLCCFCELGCNENDTPLDELLSEYGLHDATEPGQHEDCVLYQDDVVCIWFRRALDWGKRNIRHNDTNMGTIYVFAKREHIATIATDVWGGPFWPLVRKLDDGKIIIVSYRRPFASRRSATMPDFSPFCYGAQVHHIDGQNCKLSYQTDITAVKSSDQDTISVSYLAVLSDISMRGKVMLARVEYQATPDDKEAPVTMSCVETLYWRAHSREFVSPTTTAPARSQP